MKPQEFLPIFNAAKPADRAGYMLTEFLAEGGEARVYAATHRGDGDVAIKVFNEPQSQEAVESFQAEGQKLRELSSQHIIRVDWLDSLSVTAGNRRAKSTLRYPYMAMERADGSVKDFLDQPVKSEQMLAWLVQAIEGMRYAHGEDSPADAASRIVHRDLKPANLLVVGNKVKVSDFGIAVTGHHSDWSISRTQTPKGTLPYMAPEQFFGRALFASDIYSLGATGYVMATKQLPVQCSGDYYAWAIAHQEQELSPKPITRPDGTIDSLAMAIQEVCMTAMAKQPGHRFSSMGAFQEELLRSAGNAQNHSNKHTTYFDMNLPPSTLASHPSEAEKTAAYRTQLIDSSKAKDNTEESAEGNKELSNWAKSVEGPSPTRRKLLNMLVGGAILVAVGEGTRRALTSTPEKPPTTPHNSLTAKQKIIYTTAKWVLDRCQEQDRTGDVFHLARHLIPVDHTAASAYVQAAPATTRSFLAADLALYNPAEAETVMRQYETTGDYVSATRIALNLAYYGKQKQDDIDTSYTSGIPEDPKKRAALDAASRVSKACDNKDLEDMLRIASQTTYTSSNFGTPYDLAQEKLTELRTSGKHEFVEMLCRAIARDNPNVVDDCIGYYLRQTESTSGDEQLAMIGRARDLAIDLAPFAGPEVAERLDTLAAKSDTHYQAAADAVALALIPREPSQVKGYIAEDFFRHPNRYPLGVGTIQGAFTWDDTIVRYAEQPVLAWLKLAHEPSTIRAAKAKEVLTDTTAFNDYAYWLAAAALKGLTGFQE